MKDLLEAGVHFGHQTKRWNPKMKKFIFTKRKGIHIIDLQKTVEAAENAYEFVKSGVSKGKTVLFVGTKKQAQEEVKRAAEKCGMPYIILRWLGGMLTNFVTVRNSINRLKSIEKILESDDKGNLTKREILTLTREREKLNNVFSGIKDMNSLPDIMFIIDTEKEDIGVKEALHLGIPIVGVVDTNGDPDHIDYPIPGNDDAIRAINLFANLIADAVLEGKKNLQMEKEGEDQKAGGAEDSGEPESIKEKYAEYEIDDDEKKIMSFEKFEKTEDSGESEEEKEEETEETKKNDSKVKETAKKGIALKSKAVKKEKTVKTEKTKEKKAAAPKEKAKEKKETASPKKKEVRKDNKEKTKKEKVKEKK